MNSLFKILMLLMGLFISQSVFAQELTESNLTLSEDDQSKSLMFNTLFGGTSIEDISNSPLAGPVGAFNAVCLFLAGILVAYTILAGIVNTAHDGEMLGKKWSSAWLPVRHAIFAACLLPLMGGFNILQVIVVSLGMLGAGSANVVWNKFIDTAIPGATYVPIHTQMLMQETAMNMVRNNICLLVNARKDGEPDYMAATDRPDGNGYSFYSTYSDTTTNDGKLIFNYGDPSSIFRKDACGSLSFDLLQMNADNFVNRVDSSQDLKMGVYEAATSIQSAHISNLQALNTAMAAVAKKVVDNEEFDMRGEINTALSNYSSSMVSVANSAFTNAESAGNFKEALKRDGWLVAGTFYMKFVYIQGELNKVLNKQMKVEQQIQDSANNSEVAVAITRANNIIEARPKRSLEFATQDVVDSTESSSIIQWFGSKINDAMGFANGAALDAMFSSDRMDKNPVLTAITFGNRLELAGIALVGGGALTSFVPGAGDISGDIRNIGYKIGLASLLYTIVIPMMPYLLWFIAVMTWGIVLVESIVGASLWAVAHLKPDGDGVVGQAGQGYMLVLGLIIRPPLMVLGFIFSMVFIYPFGFFLDATILPAFRMVLDGSNPNFFGFFGIVGIYATMLVIMIYKCFGLITHLPDKVINWIGGNLTTQLGSNARETENAMKQYTNQKNIGTSVQQAAMGGAGKIAGKMIDEMRKPADKLEMEAGSSRGNSRGSPQEPHAEPKPSSSADDSNRLSNLKLDKKEEKQDD